MTLEELLEKEAERFQTLSLTKQTNLLQQGQIAAGLYLIESGIVRLCHYREDGKEITLQFFQSGQLVSSLESLRLGVDSLYSIETVTDCQLRFLPKSDFEELLTLYPDLKDFQLDYLSSRLFEYVSLFLDRISRSPEERYQELLDAHSDWLDKIPHHFLASYLGITAVSFSRIRKRIADH